MTAVRPDYDSDPERWQAWQAPEDVHDMIAPALCGPVLDVGCGDGRLASLVRAGVSWTGVDSSAAQLGANPYRPVVLADMRALPFRDGVFAEVTHLWCLYHVEDPVVPIREARRVLRSGGCYYASTAGRDNDPEIMWEGYPPSSFDAEEAAAIVARVFDDVEQERWDGKFSRWHRGKKSVPTATTTTFRRNEASTLSCHSGLPSAAYSCAPPSPDPGTDGGISTATDLWHRTHTSAIPVLNACASRPPTGVRGRSCWPSYAR